MLIYDNSIKKYGAHKKSGTAKILSGNYNFHSFR